MSALTCRIDVAENFSATPGGRFPEDGEYNGQRFRKEFLLPALRGYKIVEVVIDGTEGFGSSFLEEAFGGLVRAEGFAVNELSKRLRIIALDQRSLRYKRKIESYIHMAGA